MAPELACLHQAEQARAGTVYVCTYRHGLVPTLDGLSILLFGGCRLELGDQPPIPIEPTEGGGRWPSMCDNQRL